MSLARGKSASKTKLFVTIVWLTTSTTYCINTGQNRVTTGPILGFGTKVKVPQLVGDAR